MGKRVVQAKGRLAFLRRGGEEFVEDGGDIELRK